MKKSKIKDPNRFYVYVLRRPDKEDPYCEEFDQPFYVGKGSYDRVRYHRTYSKRIIKNNIKNRKPVYFIIIKLWEQGLDFTEEIVFEGYSEEEALEIETDTIEMYGRMDLGTGCLANLTDGGGGNSGWICSEELRKKRSEALKGKPGHPQSEETRSILRKIKTGIPRSKESIEKQKKTIAGVPKSPEHIAKMKERKGENHWAWGTKRSKEAIDKMKLTLKYKRWGKIINLMLEYVICLYPKK